MAKYAVAWFHKKFTIPEKNINNCVLTGRLKADADGKIEVTEFVKLYQSDNSLTGFDEILNSVLDETHWMLDKKNIETLKTEIEKKNNWGDEYYLSENLLLDGEKAKVRFYFRNVEKECEYIKSWIIENLRDLPRDNYEHMWKGIDWESRNALIGALGVQEGELNIKFQPGLHRIMAEIIKSGKSIIEWELPEVHLFNKRNKETEQRMLKKIMLKKGTNEIRRLFQQAQILQYPQKRIDEKRYSVNQYLSLGALLFFEEYFIGEGIIERALVSSEDAQAILFLAMHIVCCWRRGDILRIKFPEGEPVAEVIEGLKRGELPYSLTEKIGLAFRFLYENFHVASKQKGNLKLACTLDQERVLGIYLAICEYHRIKENRTKLFNATTSFDKLRVYEEALGKRCYSEIFGTEKFLSKTMNKAFLTAYAEETSRQFKKMRYKSLPEMLDAYLRGHKIDINKGQKTIFHYIDFASEGMSVDQISMALFQIGTFGFYKNKILAEILPEINEYDLAVRAQVIASANIDVAETEEKLMQIIKVLETVSTEGEMPKSLRELLTNKVITAVVNGSGTAKEENVFCLYSALHGGISPECKTQGFCTNCQGNTAYGSLCKYAIYSYEYVFNIVTRLYLYERRCEDLEFQIEQLEKEGNLAGADELRNLFLLEMRRKGQTEDAFEQFISDEEFPETLRDDLIDLYLEGKNVHKSIQSGE